MDRSWGLFEIWQALNLTGGFLLALVDPAWGQSVYVDEDGRSESQTLSLPYAFYNETFGFAGAYLYGVSGDPQPQSTLLGTAIVGSSGSALGALIGQDIRLFGTERLFLDPYVQIAYFNDAESFVDGDPGYPNERAGSNSSSENNFVTGNGWDNFANLTFKYMLPTGRGRDHVIDYIQLDRGIPENPAPITSWWNPFVSGKTFLELQPFYRQQEIDGEDINEDTKTNGMDLSLFWDNRDFAPNPSQGHGLNLRLSRDFGLFDSSDSWTVLQGELDRYISLGETETFRQRVIALDLWTAYSPSWTTTESGEIENRPPSYTGATLGGLWRMRGFPSQRFSDKAAIYYGAEYRVIPKWNPFNNWPSIQKHVGVEWLQFVGFAEVGRVAPDYDIANLHSSMQWNVGAGLRAWAKGIVVRMDAAWSEEGGGIQMMVGQPFQF